MLLLSLFSLRFLRFYRLYRFPGIFRTLFVVFYTVHHFIIFCLCCVHAQLFDCLKLCELIVYFATVTVTVVVSCSFYFFDNYIWDFTILGVTVTLFHNYLHNVNRIFS